VSMIVRMANYAQDEPRVYIAKQYMENLELSAYHVAIIPPSVGRVSSDVWMLLDEDISTEQVRAICFGNTPAAPLPAAHFEVFTIFAPKVDGYVARSDFLSLRLSDFTLLTNTFLRVPWSLEHLNERLTPLQKCQPSSGINWLPFYETESSSGDKIIKHIGDKKYDFNTWIGQSAGIATWSGFAIHSCPTEHYSVFETLNQELHNRFLDGSDLTGRLWLCPNPIERKRVALVRGRPNYTAGSPIYHAAKALGLDLVVISEECHWLQPDTDENNKLREAFIPCNMTEDEFTADRFVQAVRSYPHPIEGIFTLSDNFFVAVAKAAKILGLNYKNPMGAYEMAVDKYKSRCLQNTSGHAGLIHSVQELRETLQQMYDGKEVNFPRSFPIIVKPKQGWSSECVTKVTKLEDLEAAVEKAVWRGRGGAVIEPFYDGPEVDINVILADGEVVFWEVADEPPCEADAADATTDATFSPVGLTMPSSLPHFELNSAWQEMAKILNKMGFKDGIFHVEARMVNTCCEYREVQPGIVDLARKNQTMSGNVQCKLIEVNARAPGFRVSVPAKHVYGIDYFGIHMLAAIGDAQRIRMLSQPFGHRLVPAGTMSTERSQTGGQYWSHLVYISAPAAGTVAWPHGRSPCDDLKRRRPDLAAHITVAIDHVAAGERVSLFADGARTVVANLLVVSRQGRRDALALASKVRGAFHITIEP